MKIKWSHTRLRQFWRCFAFFCVVFSPGCGGGDKSGSDSNPSVPAAVVGFRGVGWQVEHYRSEGNLVTVLDGTRITAIFSFDGQMSGSAGCNNYFGTYDIENHTIRIGLAAVTKMACSGKVGVMKQEATYLENLDLAVEVLMVDSRLTLKSIYGETLVVFVLFPEISTAECSAFGWGLFCTLNYDGAVREYILYVPQSYDGNESVPLLFNFHGYSSNAEGHHRGIADFRDLTEKEKFILVVPQGSLFEGVTHWNVGANKTKQSTTDDVGFTDALISKIASEYMIDLARVYSTGMSNGGYMSYHLACLLGDRIAAIASVTGSMTPSTFNSCNPTHPTSVLQIHGTADSTVPYQGANWTLSMSEIVEYWSTYNSCNSTPSVTQFPDHNNDGSVGEVIAYSNCTNQVDVQLYKMTGMGHEWPEIERGLDISAVEVIWGFLSKYSLNGLIEQTEVNKIYN